MSRRDKRPYEERVSEFLEADEEIEKRAAGWPATAVNVVFRFGPISRQVLLTDRNLYVFELEGDERWMGGTPSRVLAQYQRGTVPVRYRLLPPTLIVRGEEIRPAGRVMIQYAAQIAKAANADPG